MTNRLNKTIATTAVVIMTAWGASVAAFPNQPLQPPAPRSVWDGVYTEEQAKRGEPVCIAKCAQCHGAKLTGGESAPPLVGGEFLSNWNGLTLDVLFERIRLTMPPDGPARIGRQQKTDILAYILSINKFPAGSSELQQKAELLKEIQFEARKRGNEDGKR
ncbi:MAG TPA: cytochrome c [Candidatus Saccharimonadales bacterium]|nr:cytochrome c [Candidatus Saccharimonadales bacterium]